MRLRNSLRLNKKAKTDLISIVYGDVISFVLKDELIGNSSQSLKIDNECLLRLRCLESIAEDSGCSFNGHQFNFTPAQISALDDHDINLLALPGRFNGRLICNFAKTTADSSFSCTVKLSLADGTTTNHYTIKGPLIYLSSSERYVLTDQQLSAFSAIENHNQLKANKRTPYENCRLVLSLQRACRDGLNADLSHFNNIEIIEPQSISVSAEVCNDGKLILTPSVGNGVHVDEVKSRLGQIDPKADTAVLKVRDKTVLLNKDRLRSFNEILSNRVVLKEDVQRFISSPTAYLDASIIDLDTGFSIRTQGAELLTHRYFGPLEDFNSDWINVQLHDVLPFKYVNRYVDSRHDLSEVRSIIGENEASGANTFKYEDNTFKIPSSKELEAVTESIHNRLLEQEYIQKHKNEHSNECNFRHTTDSSTLVAKVYDNESSDLVFGGTINCSALDYKSITFSTGGLLRKPLKHQHEGIQWLLAHLKATADNTNHDSGALLADDMGLGKTYMSLLSVREHYSYRHTRNEIPRPTLIVAPLSLLQNWADEVEETFETSPFADIVILQSDSDLGNYIASGATRETKVIIEDASSYESENLIAKVNYSLKVGSEYGPQRLDKPARLVITTYQTMRDYQFSLAKIDWEIVIFDEGQNLKNPNSMSTIAAKALKAGFKLVTSATPVENSLRELWSLLDVCAPGVLRSWEWFHECFIKPSSSIPQDDISELLRVGNKITDLLGTYMLRRTKAENLDGLPKKYTLTGDQTSRVGLYRAELNCLMQGAQLDLYNSILEEVYASHRSQRSRETLSSLHRLKLVSIHPDLIQDYEFTQSKTIMKSAKDSQKIIATLDILSSIKAKHEKVILFASSRSVQYYLSQLINVCFNVPVQIVNGSTKAVTKDASQSRKGIINNFQKSTGFMPIVMSPIAAGVGLTVTEANHVIHIERLWNPAKENQATDRTYRIGQTKDVYVYLPYSTHPSLNSFDLTLGKVIDSKMLLFNSIFAPSIIDPKNLLDTM